MTMKPRQEHRYHFWQARRCLPNHAAHNVTAKGLRFEQRKKIRAEIAFANQVEACV
jgi:hypothetical protein